MKGAAMSCNLQNFRLDVVFMLKALNTSGGLSGEAIEAGPHPHLSVNLNKNLFLKISILQICFYIIIILYLIYFQTSKS
jgi:hypothetical protein